VALIVPPVFGPSVLVPSRTWDAPLQPGASLLKRLRLKSKLDCGLPLFTENPIVSIFLVGEEKPPATHIDVYLSCRSTSLMVSSCSSTGATRDVPFCSPPFNF